jgi:serine/threonine protein kinase
MVFVTRRLHTSLNKVFEQARKGDPHPKWDPTRKSIIAVGIAAAMAYLHTKPQKPIIHRDLKPANILLNEDLEPVICDFGLSRTIDPVELFARTLDVGTSPYMAPEVMPSGNFSADEDCRYGRPVDVYSYAMILFELVTGEEPVKSFNAGFLRRGTTLKDLVIEGHRPQFPRETDAGWRRFIEECWAPRPEDRWTFPGMLRSKESLDAFRFDGCDEREFNDYCSKVLAFQNAQ